MELSFRFSSKHLNYYYLSLFLKYIKKLKFFFQVPSGHNPKDRIVDLSLNSHFLHGRHKASDYLKNLVAKFPNWTAVSFWNSQIKTFKF